LKRTEMSWTPPRSKKHIGSTLYDIRNTEYAVRIACSVLQNSVAIQ
jgi:hypothetical protein